jgi:hypothetical protein
MGITMTYAPGRCSTDADRNRISNCHVAGLDDFRATRKLKWLIEDAFCPGVGGVDGKDRQPLNPHSAERGLGNAIRLGCAANSYRGRML